MTLAEYRKHLEQMSDEEVAIEWVVQGSLFRRFAREVEQLGTAGTTGVRPTDAYDLLRRYFHVDARFDLIDDLARERFAPAELDLP